MRGSHVERTRRALEDFRKDAAGADVALVYFAGHGVEIAGEAIAAARNAILRALDGGAS